MRFPLLRSFNRRRGAHLGLLVACSLGVPFVACETNDPIPGMKDDSNPSTGTGGRVDFGDGDGDGGGGGAGGKNSGDGDGDGDGDDTVSGRDCGAAPVSTAEFSKKALLKSAGECSAYQACLFSNTTVDLGHKVTNYANRPDEESLSEARSAWVRAMETWAVTSPAQFGPVARVGTDSYHGRGIGVFIHAWPALNRCEIEKQVVTRAYDEQGFQRILPSARGLPAIEYLLFYEGTDTICASNSSTAKAWALLDDEEIARLKRDYAKALVQDLYGKSEELVNVWAAEGENFGATLANATGYGSEQEALNIVAWSLLYLYEAVRDLKVAPYAGIGAALVNPETPYAQIDIENIQANIGAFRALFQGCGENGAGIGFDDWLDAANAQDLKNDILEAVDNVAAITADFPPLHQASNEQVTSLYSELKVLSDLLKEQLFGSGSVLNLKLSASAASDTD